MNKYVIRSLILGVLTFVLFVFTVKGVYHSVDKMKVNPSESLNAVKDMYTKEERKYATFEDKGTNKKGYRQIKVRLIGQRDITSVTYSVTPYTNEVVKTDVHIERFRYTPEESIEMLKYKWTHNEVKTMEFVYKGLTKDGYYRIDAVTNEEYARQPGPDDDMGIVHYVNPNTNKLAKDIEVTTYK